MARVVESKRVGWTFAVLSYCAWGLLSPVGKVLVDEQGMPPNTLNAMRLGVASIFLMVLVGPRRGALATHVLRKDVNVWFLGITGIGLTFTFFLYSLRTIDATVATLLVFFSPLMVVPVAARWLHEPATKATWAAAFFVLGGAWLTLFGLAAPDIPRSEWLALGVGFLSVITWSVYTVHLRIVAPRHDPYALTAATFLAATAMFVVLAAVTEDFIAGAKRVLEPGIIGWFALYVVFPSVLAYILYTNALQRLRAGPVSVLLGVELLVTALVSNWITDERFPAIKIAGLVVVGAAMTAFVIWENRKAPDLLTAGPAPP